MRNFDIEIPVKIDQEGLTYVDEIILGLTNEDVEDLNNGLSINTMTTQGEVVALFPIKQTTPW